MNTSRSVTSAEHLSVWFAGFSSRKRATHSYTDQPRRDRGRPIQTIVKAGLGSRGASAESEDTDSRFTKTTLASPEGHHLISTILPKHVKEETAAAHRKQGFMHDVHITYKSNFWTKLNDTLQICEYEGVALFGPPSLIRTPVKRGALN